MFLSSLHLSVNLKQEEKWKSSYNCKWKSYESLPMILLAFEHSEVDGSHSEVIFYVHIFQV